MRKTWFVLWVLIWLAVNGAASEIMSLAHVFQLHSGLLDKDDDGFADKIALCIVIPDAPTPYERVVASEIAARANLESLVVDFTLVKTESEFHKLSSPVHPILIGQNLDKVKKWAAEKNIPLSMIKKDQGLVSLFGEIV